MTKLLEITDLDIRFDTPDGEVHAVKKASLAIEAGQCLGVVGESGSGKSQLFLGAFGLLAANGRATGSVRFRGEEILGAAPRRLNALRGGAVTMIFQDPLTALTPHMTVGRQIVEALVLHRKVSAGDAHKRACEMLDYVRIPESERRMKQYPHELSGGMRQRVMIAIATITGPELIIADEPTTALDVTVQAQVLEVLLDIKDEIDSAIILITHDLGVVAGLADQVMVMYAGRQVEM
ncbi:MAG TPA: ABC transporter ATP-binding protein, partial [Rhizomicrobium sp.]|nr:ABC transporter ATP-binding protein [Rhizomicrobium sp.]